MTMVEACEAFFAAEGMWTLSFRAAIRPVSLSRSAKRKRRESPEGALRLVYVVWHAGCVDYVGSTASGRGLRKRLKQHCSDRSALGLLYAARPDDLFVSWLPQPTLLAVRTYERALIERLRPVLNRFAERSRAPKVR